MAQKFLTNIELEAGLVDGSNSTGTSGYLLSSTGTATSWVDPAAVSVGESEQVHIACKNTSGVAISKGDPVYITGTVGASFIIQIAAADASNSAKMPAVGLAETDLGLNAEGFVIVSGVLKNLTTDPLSTSDGTPSSNDTVYVKAGGGLTKTKPTGSGNLIQNVGKVGRVNSANAGSLTVSTIMRTNDVPNLTTGKIWVGSSTYTTESTVVHLDETNSRMGINTNSPQVPLEAKYTGTEDEIVRIVGAASGKPQMTFYNDTTLHTKIVAAGNNDFSITNTHSTGDIFFAAGGATRLHIDSNSNVGIGTTSPQEKLDISAGNIRLDDSRQITWATTDANVGRVRISGSEAADNIAFFTDNSEKMRLTNTGLGIGTTSPQEKLDVRGNVHVEASSPSITLKHTSGFAQNYSITNDSNLVIEKNGTDGGGKFIIKDENDLTPFTASFDLSSPDVIISGDLIAKDKTGTTQHFIVKENNGNVGIGTSDPASRLEVNGEIDANGGDGYRIETKPWAYWASDLLTLGDWDGEGYATRIMGSNSSEVMRVTGTNVGIGTTSPARKLHVAGTARVDSTFYLGTDDSCAFFRYFNSLVITNSASTAINLGGGPGNVNNHVYIGNGNLDVNGTIRGKNYLYLEDAAGTLRTTLRSESTYATLDNGSNVLNYNAGNHYFLVGLSEKMRINSSGNVGIGTTSPGEKLEVNGTVKATATTDAYKGYIKQAYNCSPLMKTASSAYNFVPFTSTILTSTADYYNRMVAPYDGRVKKVILKHTGGATPTATNVNFKKHINDVTSSTIYTGTVTGGAAAGMQAEYNFNNSDFTFSDGDTIGVLIQGTGIGTTKTLGGMSVQIIVEYNIT